MYIILYLYMYNMPLLVGIWIGTKDAGVSKIPPE